jgi:hypothetical protein
MRPRDRELAQRLEAGLLSFDGERRPLPGIHDPMTRSTLLEQLVESIRRVKYVSVIREQKLSAQRADPNDELFDPLKAAILYQRQGQIDEAFWLVFLFVHFGKHRQAGWRYIRNIYGRLGTVDQWNWTNTSANPIAFREWLNAHQNELKRIGVRFGSHRRYQSLDANSSRGTGAIIESYVNWVKPPRNHQQIIEEALEHVKGDPRRAFDMLYRSMDTVMGFGRLARFDYLTMVGKLGLAPIEPGSTYIQASTGPLNGARLLFGGQITARLRATDLDWWLVELDAELKVGMQVLEDALCNWQKSPEEFKAFRG